MGLLNKSKSNVDKKYDARVKYVYLSSRKAIFIVTGEAKESKYSFGIPIIPLHGYYRTDGKRYTAKELSDYFVVLNLPKDADVEALRGKRVVILGYDKDELYIDNDEDEA